MFDLKTLAVIKQIKVGPGLDGIMYDEPDDKIILTNHSRPIGTLTAIDPGHRRHRRDRRARGHGARRRRGRRQGTHLRQQREQEHDPGDRREDVEGDRVVAARAVRRADRHRLRQGDRTAIFSGCSKTSVVVDADTGKVVATIPNGTRVDALGWDPSKKLIYIPNGGEGNVTVVHQDSADKYTVVATVPTFAGAKTICVDPTTHNAYLFQPERGPAPPPAADAPPPAAGADAAAVRRDRSSPPGSS